MSDKVIKVETMNGEELEIVSSTVVSQKDGKQYTELSYHSDSFSLILVPLGGDVSLDDVQQAAMVMAQIANPADYQEVSEMTDLDRHELMSQRLHEDTDLQGKLEAMEKEMERLKSIDTSKMDYMERNAITEQKGKLAFLSMDLKRKLRRAAP